MNERRELLATVRARLQRVAAGPDLSPVLEPEAITETRQLAGVLVGDEGDLEVRHLLGWLYWYRVQASTDDENSPDLQVATGLFLPCFLAGAGELPGPLGRDPRPDPRPGRVRFLRAAPGHRGAARPGRRRPGGDVQHQPLPQRRPAAHHRRRHHAGAAWPHPRHPGQPEVNAFQQALRTAASPPPGAPWPRVWWATGGLLGLLPLHTAGYHSPVPDAEPRTVLDRVISSYTPTICALRYARQHTPPPAAGVPDAAGQALIVAMPVTPGLPGQGRLPGVPAEIAMLRTLLNQPVLLTEPDPGPCAPADDAAEHVPTRASVLARLPTAAIAHFACHGSSDPADPPLSRLLLHDHDAAPLTVASLAPSTSTAPSWPTCQPATPPSPAPPNCSTRPSISPPRSSWPDSPTSSAPCGPSATSSRSPSPRPSTPTCAPARTPSTPATPPTPSTTPFTWPATATPPPPPSGPPTCTPAPDQPGARRTPAPPRAVRRRRDEWLSGLGYAGSGGPPGYR
jgi:hypothetical protein